MGTKNKLYADIMCLNEEVTGSCHLCVAKLPNGESIKFVVDCGLFQETEYYKYNTNLPFNSDELAFALVTHNHIDHTGRLPLLVKHGFDKTIFTTELTQEFLKPAMEDTSSILSGVAKRNNTSPLYCIENMQKMLTLVKGLPLFSETKIHENVKITFLDNGHLIGASMILVEIMYPGEESIYLLFTGDYSKNSTFFDVSQIPEYILQLPLNIIQESTYATTYTADAVLNFDDNLLKAVKENKTVIIPVFSLGRSQELMFRLTMLQKSGKLDASIPIYLDGKLSIRYTNLYQNFSELFKKSAQDFIPENFTFVDKNLRASLVNNNNECKIILTSSGMGSYGPAPQYITSYISSENALIHFVGYPAKDTLSRRLKDTVKLDFVKIGGVVKQKRCDVEYSTEFSSHAKLDENLSFLKQFQNIRLLLINHGETNCKDNLAKEAVMHLKARDVAIESRSTFYRVGRYGLIKELTIKFL